MAKFLTTLALMAMMTGSFAAAEHVLKTPDQFAFMEGPPSLPAGAKVAVIDGDPKKKGLFTMRLQFPPNFQIPAHWHSQNENITVIEGQLHMGVGDKLDEAKATALRPGSFAMMPAKHRHFAFTRELMTIVQLHGMGPFDITYVNPADDPRKKK